MLSAVLISIPPCSVQAAATNPDALACLFPWVDVGGGGVWNLSSALSLFCSQDPTPAPVPAAAPSCQEEQTPDGMCYYISSSGANSAWKFRTFVHTTNTKYPCKGLPALGSYATWCSYQPGPGIPTPPHSHQHLCFFWFADSGHRDGRWQVSHRRFYVRFPSDR